MSILIRRITTRRGIEARFRAALDSMSDAFYLADCVRDRSGRLLDFRVVDANAAAASRAGGRDKLVGRLFSAIVPPDLLATLSAVHADVVARRLEIQDVIAIDTPGMPRRWMRRRVMPTFPDGLVILAQDITHERAQQELSERLAAIVESSDDAIIGETPDDIVTSWNRAAERIFGYSAAEMVGQPFSRLGPPDRTDEHDEILRRILNGERVVTFELVRRHKDGQSLICSATASPIRDHLGKLASISMILRDITQERLAALERHQFFELSVDLLCTASLDGYFRRVNPAFQTTLGHDVAELTGQPFLSFVHPDDFVATIEVVKQASAGVPTIQFENRYRCKDGSYKWLSWRSVLAGDTLYAAARDVTSDKATEAALRASLKEKEVLLQEVHHRVKNNLQVIASLINMQLRKIESADIRGALEECQSRVITIALIHEKLYQSKDYSRVPFYEYLCSLAANVFDMTGVSPADIKLVLDIGNISLPVDKAIPCGLIVNELITNALKHGFPNNRAGTVRVELAAQDGLLRLCVQDDGVGLPAGFKIEESRSLGLQLVSTLCEQLDASVEILTQDGAGFCIRFALDD
jgi:PAS domain S-box-containing protein